MPIASHQLVRDPQQPKLLNRRVSVGLITTHQLAGEYLSGIIENLDEQFFASLLPQDPGALVSIAHQGGIVVVIDLFNLPSPYMEYMTAMSSLFPQCTFMAIDRSRSPADIACLIRAGFSGFLAYDEIPNDLAKALDAVSNRQIWASRQVMCAYRDLTLRRMSVMDDETGSLTTRESQVLELLRHRYTNREIAEMLHISESTVKFHVSNVLTKLNVSRRDLKQHDISLAKKHLESATKNKLQRIETRQSRIGA
jgi:DNA-binding NarL/FixJ family response regulator